MGNCTSFCDVVPQTVFLVDTHGNRRQIKVPITAAEIMLNDPGHVVSSAIQIRRDRRITAMRADEELSAGKVYLLFPVSRARSKASESDMALVDSARGKKIPKRRSSKVLPTATEEAGDKVECSFTILQSNDTGFPQRFGNTRQWQPVLEPIFEGFESHPEHATYADTKYAPAWQDLLQLKS